MSKKNIAQMIKDGARNDEIVAEMRQQGVKMHRKVKKWQGYSSSRQESEFTLSTGESVQSFMMDEHKFFEDLPSDMKSQSTHSPAHPSKWGFGPK